MTDEQRLAEITTRAEATTEGPWDAEELEFILCRGTKVIFAKYGRELQLDAEFIAHSREDIPYLLSLISDRDAEIKRLRSHITAARSFRVLNENGQADRHLSEAMIDD